MYDHEPVLHELRDDLVSHPLSPEEDRPLLLLERPKSRIGRIWQFREQDIREVGALVGTGHARPLWLAARSQLPSWWVQSAAFASIQSMRSIFADCCRRGFPSSVSPGSTTAQGNGLRLKVAIPANTTATVLVPGGAIRSVYESGRLASHSPGVTFVRVEGDAAVYEVGSGQYDFVTK